MKIFFAILLFGTLTIGCSYSTAQGLQDSGQTSNSGQTAASGQKQTSGKTEASKDEEMELATATFAGGCFWCTEAVFLALEGVDSVLPGYMGGHVDNPTYRQVCGGQTGHAEVIQIKFDPEKISFDDLLVVFFATHDPTTLNRQGNDVGTQYRSAVFFHDEEQKTSAETVKAKVDAAAMYRSPVVTEITAAAKMYVAEDYHVNYFNKNPNDGYCNAFIPAKIKKMKKLFGDKLKSDYKK